MFFRIFKTDKNFFTLNYVILHFTHKATFKMWHFTVTTVRD